MLQLPLPKKRSIIGFTLVELSIVIVIIGLIVAGVTAGRVLVKQAKFRSVVSQLGEFRVAANSFKAQYNAIPGDMTTASTYWPTCDGTPSNCNGNGNRSIDVTSGVTSELFRFWQHLHLAGLLPQNYTGITDVGSYNCQLGINTPTSSISQGGWFAHPAIPTSSGGNFAWQSTNAIGLGLCPGNDFPNYALLTPAEANSIDTKTDDGLPFLGRTRAWTGNAASGACQPSSPITTAYDLSNTAKACYMYFILF